MEKLLLMKKKLKLIKTGQVVFSEHFLSKGNSDYIIVYSTDESVRFRVSIVGASALAKELQYCVDEMTKL